MIFLSDAGRAQLKIQHRRERDGRICDRIKPILLFDDEDRDVRKAAANALKGAVPSLPPEAQIRLVKLLNEKDYSDVRLAAAAALEGAAPSLPLEAQTLLFNLLKDKENSHANEVVSSIISTSLAHTNVSQAYALLWPIYFVLSSNQKTRRKGFLVANGIYGSFE